MRILFLTTQLPYPPFSGGVIKSWRLVEHWYRTAQIRIICPLKGTDAENLGAFSEKLPGIEIAGFPLDVKRTPLNLLKSYLSAATLNVFRNKSEKIAYQVARWAEECDVIFIDHYEMGQYLPANCKAKVILHEHNAEYVMWDRMAEIETNPIKKLVLKSEGARIRKTESAYAKKADLVFAAPNDIVELEKIGVDPAKCRITYHLGEDYMLDYPDISFDETSRSLLYIGTLTWEANVDGLLWFLDQVWPILLEKNPELLFTVIGKNPDPRIVEKCRLDKNIQLIGFVEDLEPYYALARVFVIPLRFGSGIKVKLLNAMYRGVPVVTTKIGIEGLEIEQGEDLFSSQDPSEQAKAICKLLDSKSTWEKVRNNSRKKAQFYSYERLLKAHDNDLKNLLSSAERELVKQG